VVAAEVGVGTAARPAWFGTDGPPQRKRSHHRVGERDRSPWEWMPRPFGGRVMVKSRRVSGEGVYLMIVPGPERTWQWVRIELNTPVARGFATKESARAWLARALRAGVLPQGVMEVEPNLEE
jgi:hypothetical protein